MTITFTGVGCWKPQFVPNKFLSSNSVTEQRFSNSFLKLNPQAVKRYPNLSVPLPLREFIKLKLMEGTFAHTDLLYGTVTKTFGLPHRKIITVGVLVPDEDGLLEKEFKTIQTKAGEHGSGVSDDSVVLNG